MSSKPLSFSVTALILRRPCPGPPCLCFPSSLSQAPRSPPPPDRNGKVFAEPGSKFQRSRALCSGNIPVPPRLPWSSRWGTAACAPSWQRPAPAACPPQSRAATPRSAPPRSPWGPTLQMPSAGVRTASRAICLWAGTQDSCPRLPQPLRKMPPTTPTLRRPPPPGTQPDLRLGPWAPHHPPASAAGLPGLEKES